MILDHIVLVCAQIRVGAVVRLSGGTLALLDVYLRQEPRRDPEDSSVTEPQLIDDGFLLRHLTDS